MGGRFSIVTDLTKPSGPQVAEDLWPESNALGLLCYTRPTPSPSPARLLGTGLDGLEGSDGKAGPRGDPG